MTDDRRRIDVLLERVQDLDLRSKLAAEVAEMTVERKFGLVFERHLPEAIRIPDAPVRYGSTVQFREGDERLWQVKRVRGKIASLVREDEAQDAEVTELIVARKLGDPVYPGFRSIGSIERGGDKPHHLVIEGENFHALQTLQYTHGGKVDLIYIDPPYNTGSGGWIYNDKYIGDADAYAHSKWLSFMHRRLELAKQLLTPDGVLIVAIDDNEHHRLRMLLDRVFGERNFISNVVWQGGRKNDSRFISNGADYMLVYGRDVETMSALGIRWREEKPGYAAAIAEARRIWETSNGDHGAATAAWRAFLKTLRASTNATDAVTRYTSLDESGRPIFTGGNLSWPGGGGPRFDVLHPITGKPVKVPKGGWRYKPDDMQRLIAEGKVRFGADETAGAQGVQRLDEYAEWVAGSVFDVDRRKAPAHLERILGGKDFPYPKDVDVIGRWVKLATTGKPDAVVLDFFAGTGTTAEAVMRLNAEDGGRRQSIVVTNNELAAKTAARLRKAGHAPGDAGWESEGVFQKVTRPRIETVVSGVRVDGSQFDGGLDENVTFLDLTYLDRDDVELGDAYRQVAELLWAKAGAVGGVVTELAGDFAVAEHYAVLFDVNAWSRFADALRERPDVQVAYIVANSATSYGTAKRALPETVETFHLYENYLSNFEINTGESI